MAQRNSWLVAQTRRRELEARGKREITDKTQTGLEMVIADFSASMEYPAFEGRSRYQCLQEALKPYAGRIQVLAFSDRVFEVDADNLPKPMTNTAMHTALETASRLKPRHVLLISDGVPDSIPAALEAAKELAKGRSIDCLYIGPENEIGAIETMKKIAEIGRGKFKDFRIDKFSPAQLESTVDKMLYLPNPGTIQL